MKRDTGLILALDEIDVNKALKVADAVAGYVDAIKINWPLVLSAGPGIITQLSASADIICDFKVADIPNTVKLIVEGAVSRGASAVIVHAFTGEDSLRAAVAAAGDAAEIYAVTEMSHPGGVQFTAPHALELAKLGTDCGVAGFIAPATRPERIAEIRKVIGKKKIISPGVGEQGGSAASAISAGADHVIVGRSIYRSEDPGATAKRLCDEIKPLL